MNELAEIAKAKLRKKIISIVLSNLPVILVAIIVAAGFSAVGGFMDGFLTKSRLDRRPIESYTVEELYDMVADESVFSDETLEAMMVTRQGMQNIFQAVIDAKVVRTKTITIETRSISNYSMDANINHLMQGKYTVKTFPHKNVKQLVRYFDIETTVSSGDVAVGAVIEWQVLYVLAVMSAVSDSEMEHMEEETEDEGNDIYISEAYLQNIIDDFSMTYDYITDLTIGQDFYNFGELMNMTRTEQWGGDMNSEAGQITVLKPISIFARASSCWQEATYVLNDAGTRIEGIQTYTDMGAFEQAAKRYAADFEFDWFLTLLGELPGGEEVANRYQYYYDSWEQGQSYTFIPLEAHIGNESLPVGGRADDTFADFVYDPSKFGNGIGSQVVSLAVTKVGCRYSQAERFKPNVYDCSSFVYRMYKEFGIDISYQGMSTAAGIAKGFVENRKVIIQNQLQPGDLIFYSSARNGRYLNITHVAMYIGNGQRVHAKGTRWGVVIDDSPLGRTTVLTARP